MAENNYLKKIWYFIWEDNSLLSWLANIVIAFVLIKYIIFPVLGLILGSTYPVVAVVSTSMEHRGSFDSWWYAEAFCDNEKCTQSMLYSRFNITKQDFAGFKYKDGLNKGDVIFLISVKGLKKGDVAVFFSGDGKPIIHRVVSLNPLQTKGDNNKAQIMTSVLNEKEVNPEYLIGKAGLRIPAIGYIKIWFAGLVSIFGLQVS